MQENWKESSEEEEEKQKKMNRKIKENIDIIGRQRKTLEKEKIEM